MGLLDPLLLAAIVLAAFAGFAAGWLFTMRIVGACLLMALGIAALGTVIAFLIGGHIPLIQTMTENLGDYITWNLYPFVAFLVAFTVGLALGRRRRRG